MSEEGTTLRPAQEGTGRDAIWCAADAHLSQGDPVLKTFSLFLDSFAASDAGTIVLLGDIFTVWVGLPETQDSAQAEVADRLRALRGGGKRVIYISGNRDYFLEDLSPPPFDLLAERWDWTSASGGRIRFEHGDLINTSDRLYLRWRAISRGRVIPALFRALPAPLQRGVARWLERRMGRVNLAYKRYEPAKELAAWAGKLVKAGLAGAVLGHFHSDREEEVGGLKVRFVPQFREQGLHLRISDEGRWRLAAAPL